MTSSNEVAVNGHCPECGPDRRADVVAEHEVPWEDDGGYGIWGRLTYRILRCRGCQAVYFQQLEVFSEDVDHRRDPITGEWHEYLPEKITYWPAPSKRKQPEWAQTIALNTVDADLASLFDDIYVALNNDLRILAAIGIRTVFDRASQLLEVDPAKSFADKLNDLQAKGRVSSHDKESLEVLVDAGSAAAHRGWKPTPDELNGMMLILEAFLEHSFIIGNAAIALKVNIPPHQRATLSSA